MEESKSKVIHEHTPMAPRGLHFMEEVCTGMLGSEGNEQLRGQEQILLFFRVVLG